MTILSSSLARAAGVSLLLATSAAYAATLTFDERSFRPVDGFSYAGVRFGFEVGGNPSDDASYNSFGPGSITYVDDPSLEGTTAGILSLYFRDPTCDLVFGFALSAFGDIDPAAFISLYDEANNLLGTQDLIATSLISVSEGFFSYADPLTPISRVQLAFNAAEADRFALDNLSFHNVDCVPEAGTTVAGAGLAALAGLTLWRRRSAKRGQ